MPAGKFDCIEFRFRTEAANDYSRAHDDEVEGPFGLHGGVSLYADKLTRHVVHVRGKIKLGTTFDVQADLRERTVELLPGQRP